MTQNVPLITTTLGSLIDSGDAELQTGPFGTMLNASEYVPTGTPVVAVQNIGENRFIESDFVYVDDSTSERLAKYRLLEGDIIFGRKGAVDRRVLIRKNEVGWIQGSDCIRLRLSQKIDAEFLSYQLGNPFIKQWITANANGATMPSLNQEILSRLPLSLPPLPIQRRIADILSAYDDLIENNQRQIKLLEEAAMRLYREWFVFMRFPGHESVRIVDGVPEGWERVTVADCLSMSINGGWGKENPERSYQIPGKVIRGTDINDVKSGIVFSIPSRFHTEKDVISRRLSKWDIVFELSNGNIDNIGRTLLVDSYVLDVGGENLICASFCKLLRPLSPEIAIQLYLQINEMQENGLLSVYKKNGSNGINNFDFDNFLSHDFVVTNNTSYITPIMTIMDKITNLRKELVLLIKSRDALLPRLMNGGEGLKLEGGAV